MVSTGLEYRPRSAGGGSRRRVAHSSAGAARRGRNGAADRLRERGQSAARARHSPPEGDWFAHGAGRGALPDRAATVDRKPAAGGHLRSGRAADGSLDTRPLYALRISRAAALADRPNRLPDGAVRGGSRLPDQSGVRPGASFQRLARELERGLAADRPFGGPGPLEQAHEGSAGGLGGGALGGAAGGRRTSAAQ